MDDGPHYKVVMLGDSGVGKTALVNRIAEGVFTDAHVPTIGSQFFALPLDFENHRMTLELWDTAGQEVYRSLVGFYTREAKGAFLVFDVTQDGSFDGLGEWIRFAKDRAPGAKIIMFANKIDLTHARVVKSDTIQEFAAAQHVECIEGSAKTGQGTIDAFEKMGELMLQTTARAPEVVTIKPDPNKDKGTCC